MEKPDERGFVNITWPSRNIPHGGIFHTKVANPTPTQQEFIKVLLEESKLTIAQRKNDALKLRQHKEINTSHIQERIPMPRPHTSRRRSLSAIRASGIYDIDVPRPIKRGEDREIMKERLSRLMSDGDVGQQEIQVKPPEKSVKKKQALPSNKEMWNNIVNQIRERVEWLAEMEQLGEAGPHRDIINDQIAERMRALDALGVDSEPSTARSITSHSNLNSAKRGVNNRDVSKTVQKLPLKTSTEPKRRSARVGVKEENVANYEKMSPLQYSPRRRV